VYDKFFQFGAFLAAGLIIASVPGCSFMRIYLGPDLRAGVPSQELVGVVYRLDASQLNETLALARIEGQAVSYDEVVGSQLADRTVGTLNVIYPHPEAPPEFARAEVRIDAAPLPDLVQFDERSSAPAPWYRNGAHPSRATAEASHETWQLDIPYDELQQLLTRLATPHVVVTEGKTSGASIKTSYNGRHYQSNCQPVPELDQLMQRVRRDGRLVAYTRPLTARAQRLEKSSAVLAYREMHSHAVAGMNDSYVAAPASGQLQLAQSGLAAPRFDDSNRMVFLPPAGDAANRR